MSFWSGLGNLLAEAGDAAIQGANLLNEYGKKSDQALLNEYILLQIEAFDYESDDDELKLIKQKQNAIGITLGNRGYYKVSYFVNPEEWE